MTRDEINETYIQIIYLLRRMLIDCNLVHADFSEYNLLYFKQKIWIIDVSQSVEKDHPFSFEFLKRDIYNINNYYSKLGVNIFKFKSLFNVITDNKMTEQDVADEIERMKDEAMETPDSDKEINDFLLFAIPRTLSMCTDMDEINAKLAAIKNNLDTLIFGRFMGADERILKGVIYQGEDGEVDETDLLTDEEIYLMIQKENEEKKEKRKTLPPKESSFFDPFEGMTKQERQKLVKEQNREKRKNKMPKKKRKQLIKKSTGKRKKR